jgi:hypothetical protein
MEVSTNDEQLGHVNGQQGPDDDRDQTGWRGATNDQQLGHVNGQQDLTTATRPDGGEPRMTSNWGM